jgi:hypothetical protein
MLALSLVLLGCGGHTRFAYREILWHDPDDTPVPAPPRRHNPEVNWEGMRDTVFRPTDRFLDMDYLKEAENVNALDEVPDSSWFTNRRRDPASPDDQPRWVHLAPEDVERGGLVDDGPVMPLTVIEEKTAGSSMGLVVLDARGIKYQLKLDPPGYPGLVTSIEVIATRLAWAAGWNVGSNTLIEFRPEDLQLALDATTVNRFDEKRPFPRESLDGLLRHVAHEDGTIRAAASRWIEGDIVGWFSYTGRVKQDRNDRVAHQQRRDLRGFGVWAAWVDDVDTFENNTLDSYVGASGRGHVVHYQQGVGASFGRFAGRPAEYWVGREPYFTPGRLFTSLATLGMTPGAWEDRKLQKAHARSLIEWPQFGFFTADHFDPRHWKPIAPNPAFDRQTARDRYWGAKQIVALNEDELRAAIRAGRLDPVAAEHLFQVLWQRREQIARAYFSEVSPLDRFTLEGTGLCFEDLWITAGLGAEAGTSYLASERTAHGRKHLAVQQRCVMVPSTTLSTTSYRVIELGALRPGQRKVDKVVKVHLVENRGVRHVVGIER